MAFRYTFERNEYLEPVELGHAFKRLLGGKGDAQIVLDHLSKVCHAYSTTFGHDPYITARNTGRREVWLIIEDLLTMSDEEIRALSATQEGETT